MLRRPTVEWQVCGICNYDCSYCIQSKKHRVGHPSSFEIELFLRFFETLDRTWEIKVTGGEPFAFPLFANHVVPGLLSRTPHLISVLTNLSAPMSVLENFAAMTQKRLGIVSASIHPDQIDIDTFVAKTVAFRKMIDPDAALVVNGVLVPGRLDRIARVKLAVENEGLKFFPQLMKVKGGIYNYGSEDRHRLSSIIGTSPSPHDANMAPSYEGLTCWTGAEYFVLTQTGQGWRCRTAKRFKEGYLGSVLDGSLKLYTEPTSCAYDICPCTVPANRGMIEGIGTHRAID